MATSGIMMNRIETAVTALSTGSWTCSANGTKEISATGSKTGWYPFAIVGTVPNSEKMHYLFGFELTASSGSATVTAWVRNMTSSSITDTQYFYVLWIKE